MLTLELLPVLLFVAVAIFHQTDISIISLNNRRIWGILLLVASVSTGIALPIFIRTLFLNKFAKKRLVLFEEYIQYQRNLIILSSVALVCASIAYLLVVSPLYLYGSMLAALYGIYSILPFKAKINSELIYFKLQGKN